MSLSGVVVAVEDLAGVRQVGRHLGEHAETACALELTLNRLLSWTFGEFGFAFFSSPSSLTWGAGG
jgi:hypothetical protein